MTMNGYLQFCWNKSCVDVKVGEHCNKHNTARVASCWFIIYYIILYSGCCLWYLVLWFSSCWSGVELMVMCPVCRMLVNQQLENHSTKYHRQQPVYNTLELLMMGIVVPETC